MRAMENYMTGESDHAIGNNFPGERRKVIRACYVMSSSNVALKE